MKQERLLKIYKIAKKNKNGLELDSNYCLNPKPNDDKDIQDFNNKIKRMQVTLRESELIRIVEHLALYMNNENENDEYTLQNCLISFDVKDIGAYERLAELPDKDKGIITFNNIRYKNFVCSSSNVRSKKAFFIREDMFDKANEIMLCGIPTDFNYDKPFAKFNSYFGLPSTDSIPVKTFPNIVVIADPIVDIQGETVDLIKHNISKGTYSIKECKTAIPNSFADGAGLVDVSLMQKWQEELNLDYLPAAVQFRCIPGIKGNLYCFDINNFSEKCGTTKITDFWGKEWDIIEDNINCIMTVSQFKFSNIYSRLAEEESDAFKYWLDNFNQECYGYRRTFNISEVSSPLKKLKKSSFLSYQPLQTLEFTDKQIELLCKPLLDLYKDVHSDIEAFLRFRGIIDNNGDISREDRIPPYYKALKHNHSLYNDSFIKNKIKNDLKSLYLKCLSGKIYLNNANYQVLTPDLYALAAAAFKQNVEGLLKKGEVYSNYWDEKGVSEISIIRNPHIACEWCVGKVVSKNELSTRKDIDWFKYQDTGIMLSIFDSFALRLNSADYDGDHIASTPNRCLTETVKRMNIKTILSEPDTDNDSISADSDNKKTKTCPLNNISKIIKTNAMGMKNSIGDVVNKITILWSLLGDKELDDDKRTEIHNAIKQMSVIGSFVIDFAKTGEKASIPKEIEKLYKDANGKFLKKPEWMKYLNESNIRKENIKKSNARILDVNTDIPSDFTYRPGGTMQRISNYMKDQIKDITIKYDNVPEEDFSFVDLMNVNVNSYNKTYERVKDKIIELQNEYGILANIIKYDDNENELDDMKQRENNNREFKEFYSYCRNEIFAIVEDTRQINDVLDYCIHVYATDKNLINKDKSILWNAFGNEMIKRSQGKAITREFNVEKVKKTAERNKDKMKKKVQNKSLISEDILKNEDGKSGKMEISNESIKSVKKSGLDIDSQKVYLMLWGLYLRNNKLDIEFKNSKKNSVNQSAICKMCRFANDGRKFQNSIKVLKDQKLIQVDDQNLLYPKIRVLDELIVGGSTKEFDSINDYAEHINRALKK